MSVKVRRKTKPDSASLEYDELLDEAVFVVLDIETSGFSPDKGAEIIELAAVKIVRGRVVDTMEHLIEPSRPISAQITNITNITNDMLKGQKDINTVLEEFAEFSGDSTLVAHNDVFEKRFLNYYYKKIGIHLDNNWVCTMRLFNYLYPERKKLSLGSKLHDLTKHYNIVFDQETQHRALPDTEATALAFLEMRKEVFGDKYIQKELNMDTNVTLGAMVNPHSVTNFNITSVRYWEKCFNKKRDDWARRVYIHFYSDHSVRGTVFYDLYTKSFQVQSVANAYTKEDIPINLDLFEKELLDYLKIDSMKEYLVKEGVFKRVQRQFLERINDKKDFVKKEFVSNEVIYIGHTKAEVPYDTFEIRNSDKSTNIYVTNEKRGSRYKYHNNPKDIK